MPSTKQALNKYLVNEWVGRKKKTTAENPCISDPLGPTGQATSRFDGDLVFTLAFVLSYWGLNNP